MMMSRWAHRNRVAPCGRRDDLSSSRVDQVRRRKQESADDRDYQSKPRPTFAGGATAATRLRSDARPSIRGGDGHTLRRRAAARVEASGPHLNQKATFCLSRNKKVGNSSGRGGGRSTCSCGEGIVDHECFRLKRRFSFKLSKKGKNVALKRRKNEATYPPWTEEKGGKPCVCYEIEETRVKERERDPRNIWQKRLRS